MTTAAEDLRAALVADAALTALVGSRIRFDLAAEDDPTPFVVLRQVINEPIRGLDRSLHARRNVFQVECWSDTRAGAAQVMDLAEAALLAADMEPEQSDPDALDPDIGARAGVWTVEIYTDT